MPILIGSLRTHSCGNLLTCIRGLVLSTSKNELNYHSLSNSSMSSKCFLILLCLVCQKGWNVLCKGHRRARKWKERSLLGPQSAVREKTKAREFTWFCATPVQLLRLNAQELILIQNIKIKFFQMLFIFIFKALNISIIVCFLVSQAKSLHRPFFCVRPHLTKKYCMKYCIQKKMQY